MGIKEEIEQDLGRPILSALEAEGVTERYLAKKLKKELSARKIETFKARIQKSEVKEGSRGGRKKEIVSEEEAVIYSKPLVDWDTRQRARQDAHKLRGDYPAERIEARHEGDVGLNLTDALAKRIHDICNP